MKKRMVTLAVLAALAAGPAFAGTTQTITGPTTESQTSLSPSTDLNFDSSGSGSLADLTIQGTQGGTRPQSGGLSMTTDGAVTFDAAVGQGGGSGLLATGDGTAGGNGTLTYSTVEPVSSSYTPPVVNDLYILGDDPLSGSLNMTENGISGTEVAQDGLFVGDATQNTPAFAGSTTETLTSLDMGNLYASTAVDIGPNASLTVQDAAFASYAQDATDINLVGNPSPQGGAATDALSLTSVSSSGGNLAVNVYGANQDSVTIGSFSVSGNGPAGPASFVVEASNAASGVQTFALNLSGGYAAGGISIDDGNSASAGAMTATLSGDYTSSTFSAMDGGGGGTSGGGYMNLDMNGVAVDAPQGSDLQSTAVRFSGQNFFDGGLASYFNTVAIPAGASLDVNGGWHSQNDVVNDSGSVALDGPLTFGGLPGAAPASLTVNPGATFAVSAVDGSTQAVRISYANLYFFLNQSVSYPIQITGGHYLLSHDTLVISAAQGNYGNGQKLPLITTTGGTGNLTNSYTPDVVDYVYNGSGSSTIDGLTPYVQSSSAGLYLCVGSACVSAQPAPTPAPSPAPAPAPSPAPAPAPSPAPAPAPAPSPAPAPAPAPAPSPAPIKNIPVKVVTPVQETKQTVANVPHMTIQQARDTQNALISTGIVGGGPRGWWAKGMGGTQSQGVYHGVNYGLIAGYGFSVGPNGRDVAGMAFSAGQSGLGTGPNNVTKASDYGLWAYGTYYPNTSRNWKFSGTVGGGMSQNTLSSTSLGLPQMANFGGTFVGAEVRASYWKTLNDMDGIIVSPRLSLGYDQSWTNGFSTHGGSFMDVQVARQSSGQFYVEPAVLVGKKFNYRTASGNHTLFPQVRVGMVENVGPAPSASVSSGQVAGQIQGLAYPHTQGMAEVRLDVISHTRHSKGLSGNISVRQLFGGGASQTEAVAAIKYRW